VRERRAVDQHAARALGDESEEVSAVAQLDQQLATALPVHTGHGAARVELVREPDDGDSALERSERRHLATEHRQPQLGGLLALDDL
jgi:hypothetical protein